MFSPSIVKETTVLSSLTKGILYHLWMQHPAIDGVHVGVFDALGETGPYLVMTQVSLGTYASQIKS